MQTFKLSKSKIPIKTWAPKESIEESALQQLENASALPFAFKHIAVMPDVHTGYGVTIGSVLATKGVVVPNAVGVDIGCGMCAVKTSLTSIDTPTLKKIMGEIRKVVPVGFKKHKEEQDNELMPKIELQDPHPDITIPIIRQEYNNAKKSLGTLGGGNHFIEIQKGDDGHIWIMIHSGSRNLGLKVANHYNKLAQEMNEKMFSVVDKKLELAFLQRASKEGMAYLREMQYCVDFALANRKLMMERVLAIFGNQFNCGTYEIIEGHKNFENVEQAMINIAHNYAKLENHFGENVMVHRKGATLATKNIIGIIPGSQGTKSYIVKGLGNPESFNSCSHGSGRVMGRKQAIKTLNLEKEIKILDDAGVIHGLRNKNSLDEAVSCYKNIEIVMENQKDLVKVLVELAPLAVIKE